MAFWNDLIIGDGNKGNSATHERKCGEVYISSNSVSYWVSNAYLDTGITIFKDTEEGRLLTAMLAADHEDGRLEQWFERLVLRSLTPANLKAKIEAAVEAAFARGRLHQAAVIRNALDGRG